MVPAAIMRSAVTLLPRLVICAGKNREIIPQRGGETSQEVCMAIQFTLNGKAQSLDVDPQMPLLWVLRDTLNLTGTKFGCGMALCGACTVHIDSEATRSCITPVSEVAGKKVTTIEG